MGVEELVRSKGTHNRLVYYIDVGICLTDDLRDIKNFRIDTGSTYTIIALDMVDEEIANYVIKHGEKKDFASDASDNKLTLIKINVKHLSLTKNVVLHNTDIYFSPDMHNKALLGMDIFSLFEFTYRHDKSQIKGTFWLINPERMLNYLNNKYVNNNKPIEPRSVMMIEDRNSRFKCIHRTKHKNKIISYTILDEKTGNTKEISRKQLIKAIRENKITVQNLKLTSDYKIITTENIKTDCK